MYEPGELLAAVRWRTQAESKHEPLLQTSIRNDTS
jgi:hypothetical protein